MKTQFKILCFFASILFLISCGERTEQISENLGKTTSSIAVNTAEGKGDSSMGKAYKNLVDGKASDMEIILIKKGDAENCSAKGIKKSCAEVSRFKDAGKGKAKIEKTTTTITEIKWKEIKGSYGHFLMNGKLYAAKYVSKTNQMYLAEASMKNLLKGYKGFNLKAEKSDVSAYVIPAPIWDFVTGGNCCLDCFDTHRSWGLPCSADFACCAGQCSISDPRCDGDGDGDGGGGSQPPGDDDDNEQDCGESYITDGATVETGGYTCDYIGEVTPVASEDGGCEEVATNGMVFNCVPTSLVGSAPPPAETEDVSGGYY